MLSFYSHAYTFIISEAKQFGMRGNHHEISFSINFKEVLCFKTCLLFQKQVGVTLSRVFIYFSLAAWLFAFDHVAYGPIVILLIYEVYVA